MSAFTDGALFARGFGFCLAALAGCGGEPVAPEPGPSAPPATLQVEGRGDVRERFTAEVWVHGTTAYTTTWGTRTVGGVQARGNAVKIWNVAGATPILVDSLIVPDAGTLGDVQVTPDGRYLIVPTEPGPGSIVIYGLSNPVKPTLITQYASSNTASGIHTAEVQSVNGRLYGFLSVDPRPDFKARLVIVDITDPAVPREVFVREMGDPYVHDVFVRDGILMTAGWDEGITIFDVGGGGRGGTVAAPVRIGAVRTRGGKAHNIHWFHDPVTGSKRYAFVGEEGPSSMGVHSSGDIHVVDVSDMSNPREVAFFSDVPNSGTHNFSADEQRGILYAAFYNGGVRALNVRGDLSTCSVHEVSPDGRCDLRKMGREVGRGLLNVGFPVHVWGVHFAGSRVYASDMINGLWILSGVPTS